MVDLITIERAMRNTIHEFIIIFNIEGISSHDTTDIAKLNGKCGIVGGIYGIQTSAQLKE